MNCVPLATSICHSFVILCLLLSQISFYPQLKIQIRAFIPLTVRDSFVYIFDLGDSIFEYTELIAITDSNLDSNVTFKKRKHQLSHIRYHKPQIFALVLLGKGDFYHISRLMSEDCPDSRLGSCFFTETWMIAVTRDPRGLQLDGLSLPNPILLSHILLNVSTNFIQYDRRGQVHLGQCSSMEHTCLLEMCRRYDSALRMRQACVTDFDPNFSVRRTTALNVLPIVNCHRFNSPNGTSSFGIWPVLDFNVGHSCSLNDFIMSTGDSALLYIISPTTLHINRNPYTSTLEPSTWLLVAVCFVICGVYIFVLRKEHENSDRFIAAWLFCIRLALDQQIGSIKPRQIMGIVGISAMILSNLYRCHLSSEFTVVETGNPNNISSIADLLLTSTNISVVFADEYCETVKKQRQHFQFLNYDHINFYVCMELSGEFDQCDVINRMFFLDWMQQDSTLTFPETLSRLEGHMNSAQVICTSEIHSVIAERISTSQLPPAFITSQADFPSTWFTISRTIDDFSGRKYTYKLDAKSSYFSPTVGIQFPIRLKTSQMWIRRNLRAVTDSGILFKMTEEGNYRNFTRANRRLESMLKASESEFQSISLRNSWLIVIMEFCAIFLAASALVFAWEVCKLFGKKACRVVVCDVV